VMAITDPTKLARSHPPGRAVRVVRTNRIVYVDGLRRKRVSVRSRARRLARLA
jgi:hypothetical protein